MSANRIDWRDLVPPAVADAQRAWERRRSITKMRAAGWSCERIGKRLGLTEGRVRQLLKVAPMHRGPVEWWCSARIPFSLDGTAGRSRLDQCRALQHELAALLGNVVRRGA